MKRILIATAAAALCLGAPWNGPAHAQGSNPASLQSPGIGVAKPKLQGPTEQAPPALPGARAEPTAVAPASKTVTDLQPTDALFDAINRGDLPAAKDAVNRGADLNGSNVLGLTPIELAVDLGRNQISFYLLSLRGGVAGASVTSEPAAAAAGRPLSRAERLAAAKAERAERTGRNRNAAADALPTAPQTAKLFAGNGGTPIPQAGFLGFNALR